MFTGIIEEVGCVASIVNSGAGGSISIEAERVMEGTSVGDSIAVNGVCLTVADMSPHGFRADVMPETMKRSNLGGLVRASRVNLERAMPCDGRFGGHIVSGHIDCVADLVSKVRADNAFILGFSAPAFALRYIVEKGSVALNGISLTVVDASRIGFSVSVIPHTMANTNLDELQIGSHVNLECDIIAKYVEKLATFDGAGSGAEDAPGGISTSFLAENGFF